MILSIPAECSPALPFISGRAASLYRPSWASKRGLHWLTLADSQGDGLALLPTDVPLAGRANTTATGTVLLASREVAGLHGLSGSWVADHAIEGKSL